MWFMGSWGSCRGSWSGREEGEPFLSQSPDQIDPHPSVGDVESHQKKARVKALEWVSKRAALLFPGKQMGAPPLGPPSLSPATGDCRIPRLPRALLSPALDTHPLLCQSVCFLGEETSLSLVGVQHLAPGLGRTCGWPAGKRVASLIIQPVSRGWRRAPDQMAGEEPSVPRSTGSLVVASPDLKHKTLAGWRGGGNQRYGARGAPHGGLGDRADPVTASGPVSSSAALMGQSLQRKASGLCSLVGWI